MEIQELDPGTMQRWLFRAASYNNSLFNQKRKSLPRNSLADFCLSFTILTVIRQFLAAREARKSTFLDSLKEMEAGERGWE
jgi:hypothetical protein